MYRLLFPPSLLLLLSLAGCDGGSTPKDSNTPPEESDPNTGGDSDGPGPTDSDPGPSDEIDPTLSLISPTDGSILSGTYTLEAEASDDVGVTEVVLRIDDIEISFADPPYRYDWDTTTLIDGNYTISATARDAAGNTATDSASFYIQNGSFEVDAVRIVNPVAGAVLCGDVTVQAASSIPLDEIAFQIDGLTLSTDNSEPYSFDWDTTGVSNGAHTIRAVAQTADGYAVQNTISVEVSNTGTDCNNLPSISFTSPTNGSYIDGTVELSVAASDDDGVVGVAFYVDNGLLIEDTSVPYETAWNTAPFDEGPHIIKAVATDTDGQSTQVEITATIDHDAPVAIINEPTALSIVNGTVTISGTLADAVGLVSGAIRIDGVDVTACTSSPCTYEWDTTTASYGAHEIQLSGVDNVGHIGADTITVQVDNPPVVTFTNPLDGTEVDGLMDVTAEIVDDEGVYTATLTIDGSFEGVLASEPYLWEWDACDAASGPHTLEITAEDLSGSSASASINVTVDRLPVVQIVDPDGVLPETATLSAFANSDVSVTSVAWDIDGAALATATSTSSPGAEVCTVGCDASCDFLTTSADVTFLSEGSHTLTATATDINGDVGSTSIVVEVVYDQDGDGFDGSAWGGPDCDDADPLLSPDAVELCDGVDQDCDGDIDEDFDGDGDGYADMVLCGSAGTDCDDFDPTISPGEAEVCDGFDNNCDGIIDTSGVTTALTGSFGDLGSTYTANNYFYGNIYTVPDTRTLESFSAYIDPITSGDAYFVVLEATNPNGPYTQVASQTVAVSSAAGWVSSGTINVTMEPGSFYMMTVGTSILTNFSWHYDNSPSFAASGEATPVGSVGASGYNPSSVSTVPSTSRLFAQRLEMLTTPDEDIDDDGDGVNEFCGDCDDADPSRSPDAVETCDGADNDCDGSLDAGEIDADGDGDYVCGGDCDDTDPSRSTLQSESCDGIDNDCFAGVPADEVDSDGDGAMVCADDCDDADASIYPGATESCDGVDNDCDGATDASAATTAETTTFGEAGGPDVYDTIFLGNVYTFTTASTLSSFDMYVDPVSSGTNVSFRVYDATTQNGPYTLAYSVSTTISGGAGWYNSGTLNLSLTVGHYYLLGLGTQESTNFYYVTSPDLSAVGDIDPVGYYYESNTATPVTFSGAPLTTFFMYQQLTLGTYSADDIDADYDGYTPYCGDCDDTNVAQNPGEIEVCDAVDNDCDGVIPTTETDADGDGTPVCASDCDDNDPARSPGAAEICDGIDNSCDGLLGSTEVDADSDGAMVCEGDCNDASTAIGPSISEVCDGVDQDCDGTADDNPTDGLIVYADDDGDGYGDSSASFTACTLGTGYVTTSGDCNDIAFAIHPGATETCDTIDEDCDGTADEGFDYDGDGHYSSTACPSYIGDDCDDTDADISPSADEVCGDEEDNDCDGFVDTSGVLEYRDGYYGYTSSTFSNVSSDFYGNVYYANNDMTVRWFYTYMDPSSTQSYYYQVFESTTVDGTYTLMDSNSDSESGSAGWFWSDSLSIELTAGRYYLFAVGFSGTSTVYYDGSPDYTTDEGLTPIGVIASTSGYSFSTVTNDPDTSKLLRQWLDIYGPGEDDQDADGDGYTPFCDDCDDTDATTHPDASESCDGIDNNCNGVLPSDEYDNDIDGYMVCEGDCDDTTTATKPGATEACDGEDNDCDGTVPTDEADSDSDSYRVCEGDCDDTDNGVYPNHSESCDGVDEDCNDLVDDDPIDGLTYYADLDGDGYGDPSSPLNLCGLEAGAVANDDDCNDDLSTAHQGASEICDGYDNDCDSISDEGYDIDGDGYGACVDCNDANTSISPAGTEVCGNSTDEDCDGNTPYCESSGYILANTVGYFLIGENSDDYAGRTVAAAGDVNGDGYGDVLVGSYVNDEGGSAAGAAYLVHGPITAGRDLSLANAKLIGENASDEAGLAIDGAGDIDGDGYDDILVGAGNNDAGASDAGAVYLLYGPITADRDLSLADVKLTGVAANDVVGREVAGVGDVNGDGLPDILMGAVGDDEGGSTAGAAYLFYGPVSSGSVSTADVKLIGENASDYAGFAVDGAGDLDGDGYDDILVSANLNDFNGSSSGSAYVIYGPISGDLDLGAADARLYGTSASDQGGHSVAGAGDVNADGYDDVFVSAPSGDNDPSYLVYGPVSGNLDLADADATLLAERAGDDANAEIAGAGDVDGDGHDDLLVGGPSSSVNGTTSGTSWLIYGPVSGSYNLSSAFEIQGPTSSDILGTDVSGAGDLDRDGKADLIIGAHGDNTGGSYAGGAYVFMASDL